MKKFFLRPHASVRLDKLQRIAAIIVMLAAFVATPASAQAATTTSYALVNANTDRGIINIWDGTVINLAQTGTSLSVRANVSGSAGSVVFVYDSSRVKTENQAPYAIAGDDGGDYYPYTLSPGKHSLRAIPYSGANGTGTAGASLLVNFTVVSSGTTATPTPTPVPTVNPTQTPPSSTGSTVTVRPSEYTGLIGNPGMGWQSGDRVNTSGMDALGYPIKVAYLKWYWKDLETGDGVFNFSRIDSAISAARASGQKVSFRIVAMDNLVGGPSWLRNIGAKGIYTKDAPDGGNTVWSPDFNNSIVQSRHRGLLNELGRRYNGSKDIDFVDIGSIGFWGEWHYWGSSPAQAMPTTTSMHTIIDQYFNAFPNTKLVAQLQNVEGLRYAVSKGAGFRGDCLGNMDNQMKQQYDPNIANAGASNAWKNAPIEFETCWTIDYWVSHGFNISAIVDWSLSHHINGLNNKNHTVPSAAQSQINRLMKGMGYRYVLRSMSHQGTASAGQSVKLSMNWSNIGVAPSYVNYALAVQLRNSSGAVVATMVTPTGVRNWMPGDFAVDQSFTVPSGLAHGQYKLAIGIVDPSTKKPVVRLANNGRDSSGWYPISTLNVQ